MGQNRPPALQKKIGRPPPLGRTYSPKLGRLSIKRLREIVALAAGPIIAGVVTFLMGHDSKMEMAGSHMMAK